MRAEAAFGVRGSEGWRWSIITQACTSRSVFRQACARHRQQHLVILVIRREVLAPGHPVPGRGGAHLDVEGETARASRSSRRLLPTGGHAANVHAANQSGAQHRGIHTPDPVPFPLIFRASCRLTRMALS